MCIFGKYWTKRVGLFHDGYKCHFIYCAMIKSPAEMQCDGKKKCIRHCCNRKVSVIIIVCHPCRRCHCTKPTWKTHQWTKNATHTITTCQSKLSLSPSRELTWKFILWTSSRYTIVVRLPVWNGLQHFIEAGCELRKCKSDEHVREC